jgi:WD40 repeat protein
MSLPVEAQDIVMSNSSEKTPGQPRGEAVGWKTVSVFVSSTFDDMHAERDYLVKEVFPRLREWCEQRRLRLVDVDLRWGVTEADATNNKRVVDVCLRRIDDCRPFFICLLGQRYGWIPRRQDVAAETSGAYPHIAGALGAASVTEMEIQHSTVAGKHVSDAFLYLRDPSYLVDLPADPAQLRQRIYTDEAEEDAALRKEKLRRLREQKIPATGRPVRQYSARWNPELRTPEIGLPPQCPATLPENIETWRKNWQRWAGVRVADADVDEDAAEGAKAKVHNEKLTRGRLADFAVGERPLGEVIFEDLQQAIALRFPDHVEAGEQSDLQRELDLQEELIASATEGFIGRVADLAALDGYADSEDARLFAVAAAGGIGKTTLLAKWIANRRERDDVVFCRFIGVGDRSSSVDSMLASLVDELREAGRIQGEIPTDPKKLREKLPELLAECGTHGRAIIVIDALNQLDSGLGDLDWLPRAMPAGLKIVVSFKTGTPAADDLLARWRSAPRPAQRGEADARSAAGEGTRTRGGAGEVHVHECHGFQNIDDRKALVTGYLERHLKELDQAHLEALVTVPGAENPLYLRVVLGELRVFGAFGQLREKLAHDFGTTPIEAFSGVLRRMERDPAHAVVPPGTSVPLIFGLLAHAHGGLPEVAIVDLVHAEAKLEASRRRDVAASVALVLRQLRPYLAHREGRIDFFFESFNLAAKQRYTRPDAERPVRSETAWNDALANWCVNWERLEGASQRYALRWLPTHQMGAARAADAAGVMTEFGYHHTRLERLGANDVIEVTKDFTELVQAQLPADQREAVETWQRFHDEIAHFLCRPGIAPEVELMQKAYAHADTSPVTRSEEAWLEKHDFRTWWFRKLRRPKEIVRNAWLRVLEGHTALVTSVAVSANGRCAVSGSHDHTLRVWNLNTGACLRVLEGHSDAVSSVAVCADGRRAISGSWDTTLRVWNLDTGECLRVLRGHSNYVSSVAVSADDRRVVSGSWDNTVRAWDLNTGTSLRVLDGHTDEVTSVALCGDGRRALSGSKDRTLRVWNLDTGACLHVLEGHSGRVISVAVCTDGCRAVSGSTDKTVRVWDLDAGACLRIFEGHAEAVTSVAVCSDGSRAVSGSEDITLRVWNLDTGACLHVLEGHTSVVYAVAFCADSRRAVSGSGGVGGDHTLRVWDLDASASLRVFEGHTSGVSAIVLCADGRRAISGGYDQTLRVWDLDTGACLRELRGHTGGVNSVVFCADSHRAVSGGYDQTLRVWDLDTGACLRELRGHTSGVSSVVLCADGRRAVSGGRDYSDLRVWDLDSGECLHVLDGHTGWVESVALCADDRLAVSGGGNFWSPGLWVWDLDSGECLRVLEGHFGPVNSVTLCADGRRAVSGSRDKTLRVWDLDTGKCLRVLDGHTDSVLSVALHADGRRAVSGSYDHTLRVWDLDMGECLGTWCGTGAFHSVDLGKPLTHGCACIASGCDDGSVHFFELMPPGPLTRNTLATWSPTHPLLATVLDTGAVTLQQWHASSAHLEELVRSAPSSAPISSLRFSLDGTRLQVLTADKTEHILDATTLQPAPPPTCDWAAPRDTSPDGAWRAVIRDGRLVIEAAKP